MTKTFENYGALTGEMAFDLIDRMSGVEAVRVDFGRSIQSCSAYAILAIEDEDGDILDEIKIRFSDHSDRHGSDLTVRIDALIEVHEDDCGEYSHITIEEWRYQDALDKAEIKALAAIGAVRG